MKKFLLLSLILLSFKILAEDATFTIKELRMSGDQGTMISSQFLIKSGTGQIGFKTNREDFEGEIVVKDKGLLIQGTNGMYIKAESPVDITSIPETFISDALLINEDKLLSLRAGFISTSVSSFHLDVNDLLFRCEGGECGASASRLTVDNNLKIDAPTFNCPKEKCIEHFKLTINQLNSNLKFSVRSLETRGLIDLDDLSEITFTREMERLNFDGRVKIPLFGRTSFNLKAVILSVTDTEMKIEVRKAGVGKHLSVTDLTMFLARKLLGGKAYSIHDNIITIRLK